jgi:hypothetical protein
MVEPPTPTAALAVGAITFTRRPMISSARALMQRHKLAATSAVNDAMLVMFGGDAMLVMVWWRRVRVRRRWRRHQVPHGRQ